VSREPKSVLSGHYFKQVCKESVACVKTMTCTICMLSISCTSGAPSFVLGILIDIVMSNLQNYYLPGLSLEERRLHYYSELERKRAERTKRFDKVLGRNQGPSAPSTTPPTHFASSPFSVDWTSFCEFALVKMQISTTSENSLLVPYAVLFPVISYLTRSMSRDAIRQRRKGLSSGDFCAVLAIPVNKLHKRSKR
jgi:hypothetical protein